MRAEAHPARRAQAKRLLLVFLASLAVRLVAALPVLIAPTPAEGVWPLADEAGYYTQASAWARMLVDGLSGEGADAEDVTQAYGRGGWPPAHPILLALSMLTFGESPAGARIAGLFVGALTTVVVLLWTRALIGEKAGMLAAGAHLLYPPFVAFSHLLWSENLYILLLLTAFWLATIAPRHDTGGGRLALAVGAGLALGLALLTRSAGLPFLALVPAWLLWHSRQSRRWFLAAPALLAALLALWPWQHHLAEREGHFVALSTNNGYNLLLGIYPGRKGESNRARKERMNRDIRKRVKESDLSRDQAARSLAIDEMKRRPTVFARSALGRLRRLWSSQGTVVRHGLQAAYPPIHPALAGGLAAAFVLAFLAFAAAALFGLSRRPPFADRLPLALVVAAGMVPPMLSVSTPRMALPLLALLLPAVGHGLAPGRRLGRWWWTAPAALLFAAVAIYTLLAWPPSSTSAHYSAVARLPGLGKGRAAVSDRVALRADGTCAALEVRTAGSGALSGVPAGREVWSVPEGGGVLLFGLRGTAAIEPAFEVECIETGASARVEPVKAADWHRWRATELAGVERLWLGGGVIGPSPWSDYPLPPALAASPTGLEITRIAADRERAKRIAARRAAEAERAKRRAEAAAEDDEDPETAETASDPEAEVPGDT